MADVMHQRSKRATITLPGLRRQSGKNLKGLSIGGLGSREAL